MDSYEKFYRNFTRPPFAPVFHPTAEEFADPIAYVAKIRPEAEPYGVVKIVPPENFKPPFAIDTDSFQFTPRVQRLNEIEAGVRERLVFIDRVTNFWTLQGHDLAFPEVDGKPIDLYKLHVAVKAAGGSEALDRRKGWGSVAKKFNLKSSGKLRDVFENSLAPFYKAMEVEIPEDEEEEVKYCKEAGEKTSMQGRRRSARPAAGRMMAGLSTSRQSPRKSKAKKTQDPMADVVCMTCQKGDDEEQLLMCEDCNKGQHIYCCDPPLTEVPKGEWRCVACAVQVVNKTGTTFGFYDAHTTYTIQSFKNYADEFKRQYFDAEDVREVPDELVEKEFWRSITDRSQTVAVKYGADLITSKVGSGFPRKGDDHRGSEARLRQHYANHAWNLNNLPVLRESVLSHIETGISGMMVPWVYVGMCFSTFCWHTEDHWTYSINYNHWGERKIWYGIGGQDAQKFEQAVREIAPDLTSRQNDIFHHMTTQVNPALLRAKGVNVTTVHQNAGEFVITFPRAYHAGYNEGVNFAEAVNFAPIDWLSSGRLCVNEYANVRRFCVFSHDELVLKMVTSCDKLGIAMSLAALDEMLLMVKREITGRSMLRKRGMKRLVFENFESLPDDSRCCRKCNTTVFLSALCCAHDKVVCLDHLDHICDKCPFSECTLKYRYTVEELEPMVKKLEQRTTLYFEWAEEVDNLLDDKKNKPSLRTIDQMIESARQKHFPHTAPLQRLLAAHKGCQSAIEKANHLLYGKIRTRKETRIQRADTRLDLEGVAALIAEIDVLPCDLGDITENLRNMLRTVEAWSVEVDKAVESLTPLSGLKELARRGEDFEVRTPQMEALSKAIMKEDWRSKATKIVLWKAPVNKEIDETLEDQPRWDLDYVLKLIRDGTDLSGELIHEVSILHAKYKKAIKIDNMARNMGEAGNATAMEVEELWRDAREYDWCNGEGFQWMRHELLQARQFSADQISKDCSFYKIAKVMEKCQKSTVLASTGSFGRMQQIHDKLEKFTKRIVGLFKRQNSYYTLVEIIRDRDDLVALIEGHSVPRELEAPCSLLDEWDMLYEFNGVQQLTEHLNKLRVLQKTLIPALKVANSARSVRDTCVCSGTKIGKDDIITCIICRSKYHGSCCEWNVHLGHLPDGCFMCPRCFRGKRPCIEDAQAAVNLAPSNSIEVVLVKHLIQRVRNYSTQAMAIFTEMNNDPDLLDEDLRARTQELVDGVLSSEVIDFNVFHRITKLIPLVYPDIVESQIAAMSALRERPTRQNPVSVLFAAPARKGGKRRSVAKEGRKERKRSRGTNTYHSDDQTCSADTCLKPYGEQVGWIQCEAGCARWYHYVCVGQTAEGAKSIQVYTCYRCGSAESSPLVS